MTGIADGSPATALALGRAAYGAILLAVPAAVLAACGCPAPSRRECQVARALGARHLLQAAVTSRGGRRLVAAGAAADALHAASMIPVAVADSRIRRAALADAALESLLACAGVMLRSCPSGGT